MYVYVRNVYRAVFEITHLLCFTLYAYARMLYIYRLVLLKAISNWRVRVSKAICHMRLSHTRTESERPSKVTEDRDRGGSESESKVALLTKVYLGSTYCKARHWTLLIVIVGVSINLGFLVHVLPRGLL